MVAVAGVVRLGRVLLLVLDRFVIFCNCFNKLLVEVPDPIGKAATSTSRVFVLVAFLVLFGLPDGPDDPWALEIRWVLCIDSGVLVSRVSGLFWC